jgi:hypothetical protein
MGKMVAAGVGALSRETARHAIIRETARHAIIRETAHGAIIAKPRAAQHAHRSGAFLG